MRKACTLYAIATAKQHNNVDFANAACLVKAKFVEQHNGVEWFTCMLADAIGIIDHGAEVDHEKHDSEEFRHVIERTTVHLTQNKKQQCEWK